MAQLTNNFLGNSAKPYNAGPKASTALSHQFNTIGAPDNSHINKSASVDRRAPGDQQSFRIRKFSRNGSLSKRSDSAA